MDTSNATEPTPVRAISHIRVLIAVAMAAAAAAAGLLLTAPLSNARLKRDCTGGDVPTMCERTGGNYPAPPARQLTSRPAAGAP